MRKLILLLLAGAVAVGAYNYSNGRDLFQLPGTSADALKNTVRATVGDAPAAVTAAAFTSKIKAKMALDDLVKAADINVDTDGSVVTLTGDVGSKDEQRRAVRIATETAGVTKVVNHLRVR
jgi:osmotically-inducible protein OsmY